MPPLSSADWKNGRGLMEVNKPRRLSKARAYLTLSSVISVHYILPNKTTGEFHDQGNNVEK
jgi:hypothetical protein